MLGLVQAADRFDADRGTKFSSFAVPTILGELRRHFRDHCWAVHIPRPLHDRYHQVSHATEQLTTTLQRPPTVRELAVAVGVREEEILEAQESANAYSAISLDGPTSTDDSGGETSLGDILGGEDGELDRIEKREAVRPVMATVPPRERRILELWFFRGKTQAEIADELGMSQMHVSRLLATTLDNVRAVVFEDKTADQLEWPTPRPRRKAS